MNELKRRTGFSKTLAAMDRIAERDPKAARRKNSSKVTYRAYSGQEQTVTLYEQRWDIVRSGVTVLHGYQLIKGRYVRRSFAKDEVISGAIQPPEKDYPTAKHVKLTEAGADRILDGRVGHVYQVDQYSKGANGNYWVAHVIDGLGNKWSLGDGDWEVA